MPPLESNDDPAGAARQLIESALTAARRDPALAHVEVALKLALRALDSRRIDVTAIIDAGHRLEDDGRFELAAEYYQEAVHHEPEGARGWTNLGEARRRLQQWNSAVAAYAQALTCDPDYLWALAGQAESLRMMGRLEGCIEPFERALQRSPDNLFCLQGLAAALTELGDHREALPLWEHAVRLHPESGFASDGLTACHEALAAGEARTGDPAVG